MEKQQKEIEKQQKELEDLRQQIKDLMETQKQKSTNPTPNIGLTTPADSDWSTTSGPASEHTAGPSGSEGSGPDFGPHPTRRPYPTPVYLKPNKGAQWSDSSSDKDSNSPPQWGQRYPRNSPKTRRTLEDIFLAPKPQRLPREKEDLVVVALRASTRGRIGEMRDIFYDLKISKPFVNCDFIGSTVELTVPASIEQEVIQKFTEHGVTVIQDYSPLDTRFLGQAYAQLSPEQKTQKAKELFEKRMDRKLNRIPDLEKRKNLRATIILYKQTGKTTLPLAEIQRL